MLETFSDSISRIPGLRPSDLHEAQRSAKLLRRRIESGRRPTEEDWLELFPEPTVMRLAQIHLDEGPGTPVFDPEATLTGEDQQREESDDEAKAVVAEGWYELLTDIPDEGLPSELRPGERIGSWELGRIVMNVSRGMEVVHLDELPTAQGFRERMLDLARASGRLECIIGLLRTA
jgi:hypothetical protein